MADTAGSDDDLTGSKRKEQEQEQEQEEDASASTAKKRKRLHVDGDEESDADEDANADADQDAAALDAADDEEDAAEERKETSAANAGADAAEEEDDEEEEDENKVKKKKKKKDKKKKEKKSKKSKKKKNKEREREPNEDEDDEDDEEHTGSRARDTARASRFVDAEVEVEDDEDVSEDEEDDEDGDLEGFVVQDDGDGPRKRRRNRDDDEDVGELDADDYELLKENTGQDFGPSLDADVQDDDDMFPLSSRLKRKKVSARQDHYQAVPDVDELGHDDDGVITGDGDGDEDADAFVVGDKHGYDDLDDGHYGADDNDDLLDLFGANIFRDLPHEEKLEVRRRPRVAFMGQKKDAAAILEDSIRAADVPERLFRRNSMRVQLPDVNDLNEELEAEARWIYWNVFAPQRQISPFFGRIDRPRMTEDVVPVILVILRLIREEHLEAPFIIKYRLPGLPSQHSGNRDAFLDPREVEIIDEWDEKWAELSGRKAQLLNQLSQIQQLYDDDEGNVELTVVLERSHSTSDLAEFIRNSAHMTELNDAATAIRLLPVPALKPKEEKEEAVAVDGGAAAAAADHPAVAPDSGAAAGAGAEAASVPATNEQAADADASHDVADPSPADADPAHPDAAAAGDGDGDAEEEEEEEDGEYIPGAERKAARAAAAAAQADQPQQEEQEMTFEDRLNEEKEQNKLAESVRKLKRRSIQSRFSSRFDQRLMEELVAELVMTPRQFGRNLRSHNLTVTPPLPDDFQDKVDALVSPRLPSAAAVMKELQRLCAFRLAADPNVRGEIRAFFLERAVVQTRPTARGVYELKWSHPLAFAKRIRKEVLAFTDPKNDRRHYAMVCQAEKDGYVTVKIDVPHVTDFQPENSDNNQPTGDPYFDSIVHLYVGQDPACTSHELAGVRRAILLEALTKYLYPMALKHVRQYLKEMSDMHIADMMEAKFYELAREGPYVPPTNALDFQNEDGKMSGTTPGRRVMACVVGSQQQPSVFVFLNDYGEVLDHLTLSHIKSRAQAGNARDAQSYELKKKDTDALRNMVRIHEPTMIGISAEELDAKNLKSDLQTRILYERHIPTYYVDPEVAKIYMSSQRSANEFPDYPAVLRMAISIGRRVLDPLSELCGAWYTDSNSTQNDLLSLQLHAYQRTVETSVRLKCMMRALVRAVSETGVDLNAAISRPFLWPILRFVPGLGPVKCKSFVDTLRVHGSINSRAALLRVRAVGETVFRNLAAFVRVRSDKARLGYQTADEEDIKYSVLDDSRIHPESYARTFQVSVDAMSTAERDYQKYLVDDESIPEAERMRKDPVNFRSHEVLNSLVNNIHMLGELRLGEFIAEEAAAGRFVGHIFNRIVQELKDPYRDTRPPFKEPSDERLFETMTGMSPDELRCGMRVNARVMHATRTAWGVMCRLSDYGNIPAMIDLRDLSSTASGQSLAEQEAREEFIALRAPPKKVITCRIVKVKLEGGPTRFSVQLTSRSDHLNSIEKMKADHQIESKPEVGPGIREFVYEDKVDDQRVLQENQPKQKKMKTFIDRPIANPRYFNMSSEEAVKKLKADDVPVGECIVRPTRDPNKLRLSWKVTAGGHVAHLEIQEQDKPGDPLSIGQTLLIRNKKYEDLDHLVDDYMKPLESYALALTASHKYREVKTDADIDTYLETVKLESRSFPYIITHSADEKEAGVFYFWFHSGSGRRCNMRITLHADGMRLEGRSGQKFRRVSELIAAFKDALKGRSASSGSRPAPARRSRFQGQNTAGPRAYNPGEVLETRWSNGAFYPAKIQQVSLDDASGRWQYTVELLHYGKVTTVAEEDLRRGMGKAPVGPAHPGQAPGPVPGPMPMAGGQPGYGQPPGPPGQQQYGYGGYQQPMGGPYRQH